MYLECSVNSDKDERWNQIQRDVKKIGPFRLYSVFLASRCSRNILQRSRYIFLYQKLSISSTLVRSSSIFVHHYRCLNNSEQFFILANFRLYDFYLFPDLTFNFLYLFDFCNSNDFKLTRWHKHATANRTWNIFKDSCRDATRRYCPVELSIIVLQ